MEVETVEIEDVVVPESIRINTKEMKFDKELIEEFESGGGDLDVICQNDSILTCHSCIIACQSKIMRKSIKRNVGDNNANDRLCCPKFPISTMRKLITIMYGVEDMACSSASEMVQTLLAAAYYTIPWVVQAVQDSVIEFCSKSNNKEQATRCRDMLLILQENVSFSMEYPNPAYAPFDPCLQPLTDALIARLQSLALEGTVPEPIDPVAITTIVSNHLEKEDKTIRASDSLMAFISFYYVDMPEIPSDNEIFHGIIRRNTVLQQIMVDLIPDVQGKAKSKPADPSNPRNNGNGDGNDGQGSSRPYIDNQFPAGGPDGGNDDPFGGYPGLRRNRRGLSFLGRHAPGFSNLYRRRAQEEMELRLREVREARHIREEERQRLLQDRNNAQGLALYEPVVRPPVTGNPNRVTGLINPLPPSQLPPSSIDARIESPSDREVSRQFEAELQRLRFEIRQASGNIATTPAREMRDQHATLRERLKDFTKRLKNARTAAPVRGMHRNRLESLLFPIPDLNIQLSQILRRLDALELPFQRVHNDEMEFDPAVYTNSFKRIARKAAARKVEKAMKKAMEQKEAKKESRLSCMKRKVTSETLSSCFGSKFKCKPAKPSPETEEEDNKVYDVEVVKNKSSHLPSKAFKDCPRADVKVEPVEEPQPQIGMVLISDESQGSDDQAPPKPKRPRRSPSKKKK